jgi:hypothetical protein
MTFIHRTIRSRYGESKSDLFWPSTISRRNYRRDAIALKREQQIQFTHYGIKTNQSGPKLN